MFIISRPFEENNPKRAQSLKIQAEKAFLPRDLFRGLFKNHFGHDDFRRVMHARNANPQARGIAQAARDDH